MRIALVLLGVTENCGGAERFFADFFSLYTNQKSPTNKLYFFTEKKSLNILKGMGKLKSGRHVITLLEINNRFKSLVENINVIWQVVVNRIDIIHITSYGRQYYSRIKALDNLPAFIRPKIILNIVDCEIPYAYGDVKNYKHVEYINKYSPLFNTIKLDGVYTWYKLFKEFAENNNVIVSKPYIENISSRFADTSRFVPAEKKNIIVWAARMVSQKRPEMFIEALEKLSQISNEIKKWKFVMYGNGPEELKLKSLAAKHKIEYLLTINPTTPLENIFPYTTCFVSTQDYENFPSMSMMEAMAAGNAIIARNVGQTDLMVKDLKNGLLLKEDTVNALAEALKFFIEHPELHESMARESIRLTKEVHTPENFIRGIDKFWEKFS